MIVDDEPWVTVVTDQVMGDRTLQPRRVQIRRWAQLLADVTEAMRAGTDPAAPHAQELVARWMGLVEEFHGNDEELRDGLYRMYTENAEQIQRDHGGPSPAHLDFIRAAAAARG